MLGQRLLVVSNLKAKNLVGFKSHGMVLCAAKQTEEGSEVVEFVEPPLGAPVGEVVTFEGMPAPEPWSGAQVEKKKVFQACMPKLTTTDECIAVWDGQHAFMTSHGPCKTKTIANGVLR
jgi:tRNA-binding EMAP/Myf-like protein